MLNKPYFHGINHQIMKFGGGAVTMPVAHAEGRFLIFDDGYQKLVDNDQVLLKYCDDQGNVTQVANIKGSMDNIAAICNTGRNVFGMMPHPERVTGGALGEISGKLPCDSLVTVGVAATSA